MNSGKIILFIQQLSKDTLAGKIDWQRLTDYDNFKHGSNFTLGTLLFENEFRRISSLSSFYTTSISAGDIFLIDETIESGRNGTVLSGYKLYLYDDQKNSTLPLPCQAAYLYQLANSINSYLAKKEAAIESFIDSYLSQNQPDSDQ